MTKKGYVYIMRHGITNKYKIGFTKNSTVTRKNELQTGNPENITVEKEYWCNNISSLEKYLHDFFNDKRIRGEWFELSNDDFKNIDDTINKFSETMVTKKISIQQTQPKIKQNINQYTFNCVLCVEKFEYNDDLLKHLLLHEQNKTTESIDDNYHCEYCDVYFTRNYDLKRHCETEKHKLNFNKNRCLKCNKLYASRQGLLKHQKNPCIPYIDTNIITVNELKMKFELEKKDMEMKMILMQKDLEIALLKKDKEYLTDKTVKAENTADDFKSIIKYVT
jgi:hypothetical protein